MLRFGETKIEKGKFDRAKEKLNIKITKLVETKINKKYVIGYLDKVFGII